MTFQGTPTADIITVVPFPGPNIQDLVAGLRRLADQLERGEFVTGQPTHVAWVLVGEDGIDLGCFGPNVDRYRCAGFLAAALQHALPGAAR